jgi:23S rRNA (adenine2030-N6)-methyltransferase
VNYRHAFHAGNFADCLKHAVFAAALVRLQAKPAGFHVLETHAGRGLYDFQTEQARRSPEWADGVGRLWGDAQGDDLPAAFAPWVQVLRACNGDGAALRLYPGSPLVAAHHLRPQDSYAGCELHPDEHAALREALAGWPRAVAHRRDGWEAPNALLPPKDERRGLVLIDPPFERTDDHVHLAQAVIRCRERFAQAGVLAWRPLKDAALADRYLAELVNAGVRDITTVTLRVAGEGRGLGACALDLVAPPWGLVGDAGIIAALLAERLARDGAAFAQVECVQPE